MKVIFMTYTRSNQGFYAKYLPNINLVHFTIESDTKTRPPGSEVVIVASNTSIQCVLVNVGVGDNDPSFIFTLFVCTNNLVVALGV